LAVFWLKNVKNRGLPLPFRQFIKVHIVDTMIVKHAMKGKDGLHGVRGVGVECLSGKHFHCTLLAIE
jgi:hypothetical protein